jgi:hypothetical protein
MLIVRIELLPGGSFDARHTLSTMQISNISQLAAISNYAVTVLEAANPLTGEPAKLSAFEVKDHARAQSVWTLIASAVAAMKDAEATEL